MAISPGKPLISDFIGLTLRNGCLGTPWVRRLFQLKSYQGKGEPPASSSSSSPSPPAAGVSSFGSFSVFVFLSFFSFGPAQFRQQIEIRSRLTSLWLKGRAVSSNCLWNKTTWGHLADVCRGLLFFNASFALCVPTRANQIFHYGCHFSAASWISRSFFRLASFLCFLPLRGASI